MMVIIGSISLGATLCAAYIGADFFSKLNFGIFIAIGVTITIAVVSILGG